MKSEKMPLLYWLIFFFVLVETRSATMFNELTLEVDVAVPTKYLQNKQLTNPRSLLATRLLKYLLYVKSSEKHGYYLTVTSLNSIGKGKTLESFPSLTIFPVIFTCRTFTPRVGETMAGVVHWIHENGAILRCGPIRWIYLSNRKMGEYRKFVPGNKAAFINDSLSRIEVDVVVRFKVYDVKWVEKECRIKREFKVLASLEGDGSFGPVSLSGSDELDLF